MPNQLVDKPAKTQPPKQPQTGVNEQGSIVVQAHVKIFDPNTKRVYVEGRA